MAKSIFSREVSLKLESLESEIDAFQLCRILSQRARDINTERKRREAEGEIPEEELPNALVSAILELAEGRIVLVPGEITESKVFTHLTPPKREFPEQTIQKKDECQQKLMARKRFSDLSEKAMNPNIKTKTHFPLQELDEDDIQLVGEWCTLLNNLDRNSLIELIKTDSKAKWESGRLLSARSAEKIARCFYQKYEKKVKDISITQIKDVSITQIEKNDKSDWRKYDLDVEGLHVDVKNSRRSQKSKDRYTEHCVPQFKRSRENKNVIISGVLSPYLWPLDLLDNPKEHHEDAEIIFLGETDIEKQSILKCKFNDLVDFVEPNPANKYFLPPWIFDYPEYVYKEQNKARKALRGRLKTLDVARI